MKKVLLFWSLLVLPLCSMIAQRTISGTVSGDNGDPLVGASVVVKGTTKGAITDIDGKYSLSLPTDATTLVFSYTGFSTQEIAIGSSNVLDVTLAEGKVLEEAVVTAFGIKKDRSNLGYGVSQVTSEDLTMGHTTNVTNALAAKVPGLRVSGAGGSFSSSSIIVRGFTSFTGSNQPLFVVDGVSIDNGGGGSALQNGVTNSSRAIDLNQEDIESVSVLKGAAATSLYGSRAANGVVLITTKSGKAKQKQSVTYSFNYASQEINRLPEYQNSYGAGNTGVYNPNGLSSWGPKIDGRTVLLPTAYRGLNGASDTVMTLQAFPNNVSDLFRKGSNTQHNLSFQGGKDKFGYRLSMGYLDDQWILDANRLQRYNIGINATSEITKRLTAGISVNYSLNKSVRSPQGNQLANPLFRTWFTPRSWDLTGRPWAHPVTGANLDWGSGAQDNPYWTIANNLYDDQIDRIFGNFNMRYQFNDWLSANVKVGADNFTYAASSYDQIGSTGGASSSAGGIGAIRDVRNVSRIINSTAFLTAQKKFGDFDLTMVLGNEVLDQFANNSTVTGFGVTVRNFRNLNANTTQYSPGFNKWQYRLIGNFANFTAAYKNWGSIDLAVRNDQNSILPQANNSYTYYSAALKANILKILNVNSPIFSDFSIRANTGLVGSAKPDFRYSTDNYFSGAAVSDGFGPNIAFPFNSLAGFTLQNGAGNPNLKPEFTKSSEVGIDLSFWGGRIALEANAYQQKSTDIILSVPNSSAAGISSIVKNAGVLSTKGYEAALTLVPLKTKDFEWTARVNYTQFRSIVDELAPGVQNIFLGGFTTPNIRLVVGDEFGQIYGSDYNRSNTSDGTTFDANGTKFNASLPYNKDGKIVIGANGLPSATAGVQKIGNPNPRYLVGINNEFSYKGLSLGILLDIKQGGDQYSRNIADLQRNGVAIETAEKERLNADGTPAKPYIFEGVKADGTPNDIAITAEQYWGNSGKYIAAKGFIYNTSWFRIREATLNYSFPKNLLSKTPFGKATLGVFGRNLFLSSPGYPHLDPEQNALGVSNAQGLEFNALPQTRSLGVNLSVTF
ncbi:MAG: SusC/RagA family TonB-linked outer membrane protein [Saprospiraceae bacterium]|nr:SusC/RagA family TonB-linked outer membrane protein [Saprospiraceae bacterium]